MGNQTSSFKDKFIPLEQMRTVKKLHYFSHLNYLKSGNETINSLRAKPALFLFMKVLHNCDQFESEESTISARQKLLQEVLRVLNDDSLTRLYLVRDSNDAQKRNAVESAASQIRQIFGPDCWSIQLFSWLHKTLLDNLDTAKRLIYIDVLKTLKEKLPTLIYRVLQSYAETEIGNSIIQAMKSCNVEPPMVFDKNKHNIPLPKQPLVLVCPSVSGNTNGYNQHEDQSARFLLWNSILSDLLMTPLIDELMNIKFEGTSAQCTKLMMKCMERKVVELKEQFPNRPLFLMGWSIGALIACHIALKGLVDGVICLGLPLTGVDGFRGDLDASLLNNKVPTLFIVGEYSQICTPDDIEKFRLGMKGETSMIVVGGADDFLRMAPLLQNIECVTQTIVDRCILDEINKFLTYLMNHNVATSNDAGGEKYITGKAITKSGRNSDKNGKRPCGV